MSVLRRAANGRWPALARTRPGASIVFGNATVTVVHAEDQTRGRERRWVEIKLTEGAVEVDAAVDATALAQALLAAAEWTEEGPSAGPTFEAIRWSHPFRRT